MKDSTTADAPAAHQPLAGLRVVEFCSIAAGPFCTMLLADLGAEVIKVEPPDGDGLRQWPPITDGFSENFAALNRNKRSIALDLKRADDVALARRIALGCDVLVENNRPGVMDRLGLGFDALHAEHPGLIYCSISAFGQTGPRATEGGFDLTIQAASGVMSVTGEPDGPPVKCGVPIADFASGLYGAFAVAAAIASARADGRGGVHIDVPMFGCTLAIAALQTSEYLGTGRSPRRLGSAHPRNAPYRAFAAADGFFAIAAGNQALWLKVLDTVHLPQLADDPRFRSTRDRAAHQDELKALLEAVFSTAGVQHWLDTFRAAGVPHAAINDYAAALRDPQVQAMGWLEPLDLPNGVRTRTVGSPLAMNGQRPVLRRRPPALDEDAAAIRQRFAAAARAQATHAPGQAVPVPPASASEAVPAPTAAGPALIVDVAGTVWRVTLNRPERGNALSTELVAALDGVLARAEAAGPSALVIESAGRHFCTGFDLSDLDHETDATLLARFVAIELLLQRIARAPFVTAAIARGRVIGAGADLFAACAVRVVAETASFAFPGARGFGLVLGTRRLAARVGAERALAWVQSGRTIAADEAHEASLVTAIAADGAAARDVVAAGIADASADAPRGATAVGEEIDAMLRRAVVPEAGSHAAPDVRTDAAADDMGDLALLVRSAARPGLRNRVAAYVASSRGNAALR